MTPAVQWPLRNDRSAIEIVLWAHGGQGSVRRLIADTGAGTRRSVFQGNAKGDAIRLTSDPAREQSRSRAEQWRWSSLWRRERGTEKERSVLSEWPTPRPDDWVERVNRPETPAELEALRRSVRRGSPYGEATWVVETARALRLERTLRAPSRPPAVPKATDEPAGSIGSRPL